MTDQIPAAEPLDWARLEEQWSRGQDASTEDLRLALKRYRSFFERLLSI